MVINSLSIFAYVKAKTILDFYIESSLHVALSVMALTFITSIEFELYTNENLISFIGLASVVGYNFVKYFGLAKTHYRSLSKRLQGIQVISLICLLAIPYFLFKLQSTTIWTVTILGIITFLYAIPLLPNRLFLDKKKELRRISGLKIYIIALVWAGVTVLLPVFESGAPLYYDISLSFIQRFMFIIILMLPFEIRDLNYDSLRLATIPQKIGIKRTKILGTILLIIMVFLEFFKDNIQYKYLLSLGCIAVLTLACIIFSKKSQSKYYSALWVEGIPLVWVMILLIL